MAEDDTLQGKFPSELQGGGGGGGGTSDPQIIKRQPSRAPGGFLQVQNEKFTSPQFILNNNASLETYIYGNYAITLTVVSSIYTSFASDHWIDMIGVAQYGPPLAELTQLSINQSPVEYRKGYEVFSGQ